MGGECRPCQPVTRRRQTPGGAQAWRRQQKRGVVARKGPRGPWPRTYSRATEAQWVLAKFAYGPEDKNLVGEEVDLYLLRNCGASWEKLGTTTTTEEGKHPAIEACQTRGAG